MRYYRNFRVFTGTNTIEIVDTFGKPDSELQRKLKFINKVDIRKKCIKFIRFIFSKYICKIYIMADIR